MRSKEVGNQGLFGFVLAQPEFPWRDLLEQVPVCLESERRQREKNTRRSGQISHLRVLYSPNCESLKG